MKASTKNWNTFASTAVMLSAIMLLVGCGAQSTADPSSAVANTTTSDTAALDTLAAEEKRRRRGPGLATAPEHLKYFGFYIVQVGFDDPTDSVTKRNYSDEVGSFTNLNQAAAYYPTQDLTADITAMTAACTQPFMSIGPLLWYRADGNAPGGTRLALYPDWKTRWATFKTTNLALLNAKNIGAFYMPDEPTWNGVPFAELDLVSRTIKADYPEIPILLVEAYPVLNELQVPTSVDWIGFDRYGIFNPGGDAVYLNDLATLKSKRSNRQKIVLIEDTQWRPSYRKSAGIEPNMMGPTFNSYYALAAADPDVIGLLGYIWPSGFDSPDALGARGLPADMQAILINQGKSIKANFSPCR